MGGTTTLTMPDANGYHVGPNPPNVQQPSSVPPPDSNALVMPDANGYQMPAAPVNPAAPTKPTAPRSFANIASDLFHATPGGAEMVGFGKEAANALAGLTDIVNEHAEGRVSPAARQHMQRAAAWLREQGELRGWTEEGGAAEHMGAMGADYLGYEGLASLIGGAGAKVAAGAAKGSEVVQTAKQVAQVGELLDKFPPLKHAVGIGLRTINAAMTGYGQQYVMSGGDTGEALQTGLLTGVLHAGSAPLAEGFGKYVTGLEREAEEALQGRKPLPPPVYTPGTPKPVYTAPEPVQPVPPPERAPAAERFAAHEREAAQGVTGEHLEDLNKYRTVNEAGTPTNIQQLGLPSRSTTEPYQFHIPGWSETTEAGDILHPAQARYAQRGTRLVEGKGTANMQPWEMKNIPFNEAEWSREGGVYPEGEPAPPPPMQPGQAAEPPTSPYYHKEPILQATEFRPAVRPGSEIRQATTVGGPSVLTTDPEVAAAHLENVDRIIESPNFSKRPFQQQVDILHSRSQVMRQMNEYQQLLPQHEYSPYLHQPTFAPANIDEALARTGDMGDAAEEMMRGPKEAYQRWTQLTKGRFQRLNAEIEDLRGKTDAKSARRLDQAEAEMQQMFNGSDPQLGRAGTNIDLAINRAHFRDGYLVKKVDNAFTDAWKGADRTGDFDVGRLQRNWKAVVNKNGAARLQSVYGPERYEAMNNFINDMAGEPAAEKTATAAAEQEAKEATKAAAERAKAEHEGRLAEWEQAEELRKNINKARIGEYKRLEAIRTMNPRQQWYYDLAKNGWHHIASKAGMEAVANIAPRGLLGAVTHKVGIGLILKQIATHPAVAKAAYWLARQGAKPEVYGPFIGDMIHMYNQRQNEPPPLTPPPEPQQESTNP